MKFIIKKYESKDEDQLKELFNLSFEEKGLMNIINRSILKFAYSAFFENKLVGVMFAWESSFHPHCIYFRILCNPFYTGLNIEERLLSKAEELETINASLQTSI